VIALKYGGRATQAARFWEYWGFVVGQFRRDVGNHIIAHIIAAIIAAVAAFAQAKYGLIRADQAVTSAAINAAVPLAILALYLGWYALRAPWKVYNEVLAGHEAARADLNKSHQDIRDHIEASHNETKRELQAIRNELDDERDKNAKPEITLELESGLFQRDIWVSSSGGANPGDAPIENQTLYVTVVVRFFNSRRDATIDICSLSITNKDGEVEAIRLSEFTPLRQTERNLYRPRSVGPIEPNLLVRSGTGATRYIEFVLPNYKLNDNKDIDDNAVVTFTAVDSFKIKHAVKEEAKPLVLRSGLHKARTLGLTS
jgi:hypothetical protein